MITKTFSLENGHSVAGIARAIDAFLRRGERMDVTRYRCEDGSYLICARVKEGRALRWAGMDRSITVSIFPGRKGQAIVKICGCRWRDKGLALGTSLFMLWPLALTAGVGTLRQICLPKQILSAIRCYLKHNPQDRSYFIC